jgi:hypothetical protein
MLQNSMVAGIDLTSPRRSAGLISGTSLRFISCWKTPQIAGNSLSQLQEIQNFLVRYARLAPSVVDSVVSES